MKKTIACLLALMLCLALSLPVSAAQTDFVPSVTYKDGPEIKDAELSGEGVGDCLVVTSIREAKEKTTDIHQEDRDLLLEVYKEITNGNMELPLEEDYVVLELVDVSFAANGCVEPDHPHEEDLAKEGTTLEVDFSLNVDPGVKVVVLVYLDGEWIPVETVNNGDGTVTCTFEDICPVAFAVPDDTRLDPPKTGDTSNIGLWVAVMLLALVGIVATALIYRSKTKHRHRRK